MINTNKRFICPCCGYPTLEESQKANGANREACLSLLKSKKSEEISDGLLSLTLYDDDWQLIQNKCIEFSSHHDPEVSGIAILCFGHMARIHGKISKDIVLPIIERALIDSNSFVKGHAESALDDIRHFIK